MAIRAPDGANNCEKSLKIGETSFVYPWIRTWFWDWGSEASISFHQVVGHCSTTGWIRNCCRSYLNIVF